MEDNKLFHKCVYRQLDQERKRLKTHSPLLLTLKNVVEKKKILEDINYLSKFCHAESLKIFHSILNKYFRKKLHFKLKDNIARI